MQNLAEEFKLCTAAQIRAQNMLLYEGISSYNMCGDSLKNSTVPLRRRKSQLQRGILCFGVVQD
jgi:hypothetical protein